jgi:hypothetical protein
MFVDLKSSGLYDKLYTLYPALGGTANSVKWNALNPVDTDAAFRLTYTGGVSFSQDKGYILNGTNSYAQTYFNPQAQSVPYTSFTMFEYVTTDGNEGYDMGCAASSIFTGLASRRSGNFQGQIVINNFLSTLSASTTALGAHLLTRNGSTTQVSYVQNGGAVTTISQTTTSTLQPNTNILIGVYGGVGLYSDKALSTVGFAEGLSTTEMEDLRDIITTFNTTIGR